MKNLIPFNDDSFKFHEEVIKGKNQTKADPTFKQRLELINPDVKIAFAEYLKLFKTKSLVKAKPLGYFGQNKKDLQNLYSFSNTKIQELLRLITTTPENRKRSICCNCTISEINSFDHVLPQGEFPEYSVNPLNLIPSCSNCNSRKGVNWKLLDKTIFLNHYIDELPDIQILFANIEVKSAFDIDIKFNLVKPKEIGQEFFDLIESHYTRLNLFQRFINNADDVVSEFENQIQTYSAIMSRLDVDYCIDESNKKNMLLYGKNDWKCVLRKALFENNKFMSRFNFRV